MLSMLVSADADAAARLSLFSATTSVGSPAYYLSRQFSEGNLSAREGVATTVGCAQLDSANGHD